MRILAALLLLSFPASGQSVWTLRSAPVPGSLLRPAGKAGSYVIPTGNFPIAGLQQYLRSTDGVTWTTVSLPVSEPDGFAPALVCFNNRFLGHTYDGLWYSDDGITSTPCFTPAPDLNFTRAGIAFGNSIWIITLRNGEYLRSTDNCVSWQLHASPAARLYNLAFGAGKFLALADGGSLLSPDGLTWSILPAVGGDELCFASGRFLTTSRHSANGSSWVPLTSTSLQPDASYHLRSGNGQFLTWELGWQPPSFHTTTTGPWSSAVTAPVLDHVTDAEFCGDMWIAITNGRRILTSPIPTLQPPVAPPLNIERALRLTWQSQTGRSYIVQRSTNQTQWTDHTGTMLGTGAVMEWLAPTTVPREFFRVQVR